MAVRDRRSLWGSISTSKKVNRLSLKAALLYTWAIAYFDDYGFQDGDPRILKGTVFPKRDDVTQEEIPGLIEEIIASDDGDIPLWNLYIVDNEVFLQDPVWFQRQTFHGIRKKPSKILALLTEHQINTGLSPELVSEGCASEVKKKLSEEEVKGSEVKCLSTPEAQRLAHLLLERIKVWFPKFKPPERISGWSKPIDEMMRLDGREEKDIEQVIKWCQSDSFWRKNILSGNTLRLKFNRLQAEMISPEKSKKDPTRGMRELDRKVQESFSRIKPKELK